jgi:hypothetical protein
MFVRNIYTVSEPRIPHSEQSPTSKPEITDFNVLFGGYFTLLYHAQLNEELHSREGQRGIFGDHIFKGPKSTIALSYTQCVSEYLFPS